MGNRGSAPSRRSSLGLAGAICAFLVLAVSAPASAHSGDDLGEFAATPTVDGVLGASEYEGSCESANLSAGSTSYSLTVCEANDETNDYWAIAINDLSNDSSGQLGDSPLIWFDNNHDGAVEPGANNDCAPFGGNVEDYIGVAFNIFIDSYYCYVPPFTGGFGDSGSFDGTMARNFTAGTGWVFEFAHPLNSADPDDYSLNFGDTAGWCLTYDDKSNPTNSHAFGELVYPPGCWVDVATHVDAVNGITTKYGDVFKESQLHDQLFDLKKKLAGLVATCIPCPPDPGPKLREKINEVLEAYEVENPTTALKRLQRVIKFARKLLTAGDLRQPRASRVIGALKTFAKELKTPGPAPDFAPGPGTSPGSSHAGERFEATADGQPPPRSPRPIGP